VSTSAITVHARLCSLVAHSFPRTIEKVDKLIGDGLAPTPVIISVIASDPLFAAAVLGQANINANEITQLSQAVLHLGLSMVQGLNRSLMPLPRERMPLMAGYWSEANACAAMTRVVVDYRPMLFMGSIDDETAHIAGLLHNLGSIVASLHFQPAFDKAITSLNAGEGPFAKLLGGELGMAPGDLAVQLGALWQLPELVVTVAQYYRHPIRAPRFRELCCAVHVGHLLARGCGYCPDEDCFVEPVDEEALSLLNLGLTDMPRLLERFFDEMEDLEFYEPNLIRA
jgi:HD-like signal output (HDOD) protein